MQITNERQARITRAQIRQFEADIEDAKKSNPPQGIDPRFHEAAIRGMEEQHRALKESLEEYERLREGAVDSVSLDSVEAIGLLLIQSRISMQMSQAELAALCEMKPQQIQRYEQQRYRQATFGNIVQIANALGVRLCENVELPTPQKRRSLSKAG